MAGVTVTERKTKDPFRKIDRPYIFLDKQDIFFFPDISPLYTSLSLDFVVSRCSKLKVSLRFPDDRVTIARENRFYNFHNGSYDMLSMKCASIIVVITIPGTCREYICELCPNKLKWAFFSFPLARSLANLDNSSPLTK